MSDVQSTLKQRGEEYGPFEGHAHVTQEMFGIFKAHCRRPLTEVQIEGLHMIFHKLGRIANGNPDNSDSWHDIAGYATLVEEDIIRRKSVGDKQAAQEKYGKDKQTEPTATEIAGGYAINPGHSGDCGPGYGGRRS